MDSSPFTREAEFDLEVAQLLEVIAEHTAARDFGKYDTILESEIAGLVHLANSYRARAEEMTAKGERNERCVCDHAASQHGLSGCDATIGNYNECTCPHGVADAERPNRNQAKLAVQRAAATASPR